MKSYTDITISFDRFYGNVSSLSMHALEYVSTLPKSVKALALVETHKPDHLSVSNKFERMDSSHILMKQHLG